MNHGDVYRPTIVSAYGWICPVCGRGVSPQLSNCPCQLGPYGYQCSYGCSYWYTCPDCGQLVSTSYAHACPGKPARTTTTDSGTIFEEGT